MLGSNVSTVGGIQNAFIQAKLWDCDCIQIYVTPSRKWEVPRRLDSAISDFTNAWAGSRTSAIVAHVPFLVNLASPDDGVRMRSISRLATEIDAAGELGIDLVVLHPGSYRYGSKHEGLIRIVEGLSEAINKAQSTKPRILLETMAGQGTSLGSTFEEMRYLLDTVVERKRVGVCFDTCHVYASGYDMRGYSGYERTMNELDAVLGLQSVLAFHLNDSKGKCGSHLDRHCSIGQGHLGLEAFHALLSDRRFNRLPKIVENPDRDRMSNEDLQLLRGLLSTKERLVDVPSEAADTEKKQLDIFGP